MASSAVAAPRSRQSSHLPVLRIESGTLEALKWLGLVLMTVDHVNKYLLHDAFPAVFDAGRLALPLFSFVLAHHLAQPRSMARGVHGRVAGRLAIAGAVGAVPFIGLGGLVWEWWPLNVMFTLLVATGVIALLERGGAWRVVAAGVLFFLGGAMVEFWWPAIVMTLAAWRYVRRPSWTTLLLWSAAIASLYVINRNLWALAALPLIFLAPRTVIVLPRVRGVFYAFYPLHLWVLWMLTKV